MSASRSNDRSSPTVIVSRRVVPGREAEFEAWMRRIRDAAFLAPGHVASEYQPPGPSHPDQWTVVYRFEDAATRSAWLESEARRTLIAEGADLVLGDPVEQVLAVDSTTGQPVTAVASVRLRPGAESRYRALHDELLERLEAFDGYLWSTFYEAVPGVQDDTVVVFAFEDRSSLDAWLVSEARTEVLDRMDDLVEGDRTLNVVGGFAGWFPDNGGTSVKIWKQSAVVLLALFPTALVLGSLKERFLPGLPWAPGVFLGNALGVAILSWILMPWLTRLLEPWLRR